MACVRCEESWARYGSNHSLHCDTKVHADAGLFLLLQAAELPVQLDVKKAGPYSMALIAAIWNGSCMKVRLGTVLSNKFQLSRLPQGAPVSPDIFTMILDLVLRDLIKSWKILKLAWSLGDFVLAAIWKDDVVLVAASVAVAEVMVVEVIAKLKEVGLSVGAQKTHWTSHPKVVGTSIGVDGLAVLREEVLEFVGSKVCLDGNASYSIAQDCSNQRVFGEVETSSEFFMALKESAPEHVKTTVWQAFLWSSSVWTTVTAQRDKIASWCARMVANVVGMKKPPLMEMDQWWRPWHRTGHRWIEKCNMNVLSAIRDRVLSCAGHVARIDYSQICAKALRCRGLQWWRWRQLH